MHKIQWLGAFLALSGTSAADVFIVDSAGGPGFDFYDLPEAVASPAVRDGDSLHVRGGAYSGFITHKGISIEEISGAVDVNGSIHFMGLAAGPFASLEGIDADHLGVTACDGVVFVEDGSFRTVQVASSADVRMRELGVHPPAAGDATHGTTAMIVLGGSHVEVVECSLAGGDGGDGELIDAGDGGEGLYIAGGAIVQLALSSSRGGDGGNQYYPEWGHVAGDGGNGVEVSPGAELIVSGEASDLIEGGIGGFDAWGWGYDGYDGEGLWNAGSARISGATVNDIWSGGYLEQPAVADPVLKSTRIPGGGLRIEVIGEPGGNVRLHLGSRPTLSAAASLEKPAMAVTRLVIPLELIPPSGTLVYEFGGSFPTLQGQRFALLPQASVVFAGESTRSNSRTWVRL